MRAARVLTGFIRFKQREATPDNTEGSRLVAGVSCPEPGEFLDRHSESTEPAPRGIGLPRSLGGQAVYRGKCDIGEVG